jgi:hypothetical protein
MALPIDECSIANFAAVADGKQHDLLPTKPIKNDIRAVAELDDPFAKLRRKFVDGRFPDGWSGPSRPDGWL